MRQLVSLRMAAQAWGVSEQLVRKLIRRHNLQVIRLGSRVLLDSELVSDIARRGLSGRSTVNETAPVR